MKKSTNKKVNGLGDVYRPSSKGKSLQVDTPDSMSYEIHEALKKLTDKVGSIDEYVRMKLAYRSTNELQNALSAEQIDAVALAVYNIEAKNESIIIGDQTGIGKGRIAASMIRYGIVSGNKPIFITEKPNLFSDLYRDLKAIGAEKYRPYIVNAKESKTLIKDEDGVVVFEPLDPQTQQKVINSGRLPKEYDYVMLTYSQISDSEVDSKGNYKGVSPKLAFIRNLAENNTMVLDESHNASGNSNTGKSLQDIVSRTRGVTFLSATFAKRPDNIPLYAMKTAMSEANLTPEGLQEAIIKGGVALQEVLSAQLVQQGQMIRRERSFEGIEVNYLTTDDLAPQQMAIADSITDIMRDIIRFQEDFVKPEIELMDRIAAATGKEVGGRKGTDKAGVDNSPYFSKVFQAINQMLFAIKADAVADRAIMRLKQGKKPVIAFASTMGSFIESLTDDNGQPLREGDSVQADFATVLIRGLEGVMRYTVTEPDGTKKSNIFEIAEFSDEARAVYRSIMNKIQRSSAGITISPIDQIKQKLEKAGYRVAEVTGRKYELILEERLVGKESSEKEFSGKTVIPKVVKEFIPDIQQKIVQNSGEFIGIVQDLEKQVESLIKIGKADKYIEDARKAAGSSMLKYADIIEFPIRYFIGSSQFFISEWDGKDELFGFGVLNDDWQSAELGYFSLSELKSLKTPKGYPIELDFHWTPKTLKEIKKSERGLGKAKGLGKIEPSNKQVKKIIGTIKVRKRENTNDAFRRFNDNEVDVLMINQSGSTGASAHAIPTKRVTANEVKQRVMIVLQAELDINTEVQKRGRINRTGQIMKPIYDYVTCAVPAEKRLMMMLQKKLKSLDANTTSNQKNSEALLKSDDFLNKYGDDVVVEYLKENKPFNTKIGDPFDFNKPKDDSGKEPKTVENAAHKVTGRVAVLPTKEQEEFYTEIIARYQQYVALLIEQGDYDLEVETQNLRAVTLDRTILVANNSGSSPFSENTYLEKCEVDTIKKPLSTNELKDRVEKVLDGLTPKQYAVNLVQKAQDTILKRVDFLVKEEEVYYERAKNNITDEKPYKKLKTQEERSAYIFQRESEIDNALREEINKIKDKYDNQFDSLKNLFEFFTIGRELRYRSDPSADVSTASSMAVSLGFKIGSNKKNAFAPSNVSLQLAVASSTRQLTIPLSGKTESLAYAIKGASSSMPIPYNSMLENWTNAIKLSSKDRMIRYIATGNLLQFFGQEAVPKSKLIQFTTFDNKVRKGALMPEYYAQMMSNIGSQAKIILPIDKCGTIIKNMDSGVRGIDCSANLKILKDGNKYKFILPTSRQTGGYVYLNPEVLKYVEGGNFFTMSNKMVGFCSNANLQNLLDALGKLKINTSISLEEFKQIESEFKVAKTLNDEIRPVERQKPIEVVDKDKKVKIARAKLLLARARLRLTLAL